MTDHIEPEAATARVAEAVANLAHTVDVFGTDVEPDDMAIVATRDGKGGRTGLTWGDLHTLREHIEHTAPAPDAALTPTKENAS